MPKVRQAMAALEAAAIDARRVVRRIDRFAAVWEAQGYIPWQASVPVSGLLALLLGQDEITIRGKVPVTPDAVSHTDRE